MFKHLADILGPLAPKEKDASSSHHLKTSPKSFRFKHGSDHNAAFDFLALIKAWPEIVGPRLAQFTIPLKNKHQTLTILTGHGAYSQQLSFMETILIKKITDYFPALKGTIKKLYFQTNPSFFTQFLEQMHSNLNTLPKKVAASTATFHPQSPQYKLLKRKAEQLFKDIEDETLKEKLTSLYLQIH